MSELGWWARFRAVWRHGQASINVPEVTEADWRAVGEDFRAVGDDMRAAMRKYAKENGLPYPPAAPPEQQSTAEP